MEFLGIEIPDWDPQPAYRITEAGERVLDEFHPATRIAKLWLRLRTRNDLDQKTEFPILWFAYTDSDTWRMRSRRKLNKYPICQWCNKARSTDAHHQVYSNRFFEPADDLIASCNECHAKWHGKEPNKPNPGVPKRPFVRETTIAGLQKITPAWVPVSDPLCPCDPCQGLAQGRCWREMEAEKLYFDGKQTG